MGTIKKEKEKGAQRKENAEFSNYIHSYRRGDNAIMSVGVLFDRKPVQGSYGGMNNIGGLNDCEICGGEPQKCERNEAA